MTIYDYISPAIGHRTPIHSHLQISYSSITSLLPHFSLPCSTPFSSPYQFSLPSPRVNGTAAVWTTIRSSSAIKPATRTVTVMLATIWPVSICFAMASDVRDVDD
uniref:Uncharacterized protein n=1 Tax=Caenorhabditis japonica TaxID=281687 RepID=A0A8R1I0P5_CAEJA